MSFVNNIHDFFAPPHVHKYWLKKFYEEAAGASVAIPGSVGLWYWMAANVVTGNISGTVYCLLNGTALTNRAIYHFVNARSIYRNQIAPKP